MKSSATAVAETPRVKARTETRSNDIHRVASQTSLGLTRDGALDEADRTYYNDRVSPVKLPGWVVDEDTSIRRETEPLVGATPAQCWSRTQLCARDALWAVRHGIDPERVLAYRDPLPPSTEAALARLRKRRTAGA
jgi:hypothetical protein